MDAFQDIAANNSMYYGSRTLLDQHRDMRLDVDNMSYEVTFSSIFLDATTAIWYESVFTVLILTTKTYAIGLSRSSLH